MLTDSLFAVSAVQLDLPAVIGLVVLILLAFWLALSNRGQKAAPAPAAVDARPARMAVPAPAGNTDAMTLVMTRMLEQFEQLEKRMLLLDTSLERLGTDMTLIKGEVAQTRQSVNASVIPEGALLPPNPTPEQVVTVAHRLAEEGLPAKEIAPMMNISRSEAELLIFLREVIEKKHREAVK